MRKIKIISFILSVFLFVTCLASCAPQGSGDGSSSNQATATVKQSENHYANNRARTDYIVKDGKAYYTLVLPARAADYEVYAADLIVEYYQKATGVKLETTTDNQALPTSGRYISIGDTKLLRNSGIAIPIDKFGKSGFRLETRNNVIFIAGARSNLREGTYFGAQEFLYYTLNWRAYALSEIKYDQKATVKSIDFDVTEIPDFDDRSLSYKPVFYAKGSDSNDYAKLMRFSSFKEILATSGHSHYQILPLNPYFYEHPEWYYQWDEADKCPQGANHMKFHTQLCLSNEEMTEEFIKQLTNMLFEDADATFIHLGQNDNEVFCNCEKCSKWMKDRNTNNSGMNIWFTNKVARAVQANIHAVDPGRDLTFQCFAYSSTDVAPTHKDENGKWVADHEDVIPDDNVYIQYTPCFADLRQSLDHPLNSEYYDWLQGYNAITDNMSTWLYLVDFVNYCVSMRDWDIFKENWRILKENGVKRAYIQGPMYQNIFQMHEMRIWIQSKMLWNLDYTWEELAEEFIREFYGPAATEVQAYYDLMTTHYEKMRTVDGFSGKISWNGPTVIDARYWPFSYVEAARSVFMDGYKQLDAIKETDQGDYAKYNMRLSQVYFENMYMQLMLYYENYSYEQRLETLTLFKQLVYQYSIDEKEQGSTLRERIKQWEEALNAG